VFPLVRKRGSLALEKPNAEEIGSYQNKLLALAAVMHNGIAFCDVLN